MPEKYHAVTLRENGCFAACCCLPPFGGSGGLCSTNKDTSGFTMRGQAKV